MKLIRAYGSTAYGFMAPQLFMLAYLRGTIKNVYENALLVDVGGVGYEVHCIERECAKLKRKQGGEVELYTHYYLREDTAELYGFLTREELVMFRILINISGIGPKGALNILNAAPIDILQRAIAAGDTSVLTKISGIGNKIAQKIIVELGDKFGEAWSVGGDVRSEGDVVEALEILGYSKAQVHEVLKKLPQSAKSTEEKVREALKILGARS